MKDYYNQRINCEAKDCHYYDKKECKCSLGCITISKHKIVCKNYEKDEL